MSRLVLFFILSLLTLSARGEGYSSDFQGVDIQQFINTVSKNLNKTIIIDEEVQGTVTVKSYETLDDQAYYQFFLNVLDVYGYAVITMPGNVLKVLPAKDGKRAVLASSEEAGIGDELIINVVSLHNVPARDIAPVLRYYNDSVGIGNVTHIENSNMLVISGRANIVNKLADLARNMDQKNAETVQSVPLIHASATEVTRIVNELVRGDKHTKFGGSVSADERTNSAVISGDSVSLNYLRNMIVSLDKETASHGSTKVFNLKYAKAKGLMDVLTGVSSSLENKQSNAQVSLVKNVVIRADDQTNSLVISAPPDVMRDLSSVIDQLDVRRAQVLVEAIIVEMQDADGINFGIQWANKFGGGSFSNKQSSMDGLFKNGMSDIFKGANGLATGFYHGNWAVLLNAIQHRTQSNILATPSIVTLDNEEATFSVGKDVPILSGSRTTNNDNVFNTVARKTVGIKLKVKPQINQGQSVLMQIEQEVSSVDETAVGDKNSLGDIFNIRTLNNSVLIDSGETVVVGGLLDKSQQESKSGVPFLSQIPFLGNLFRSENSGGEKRNLILFIRPTIIRNTESHALESGRKTLDFGDAVDNRKKWKTALDDKIGEIQSYDNAAFLRAKSQIAAFYGDKE